MEFLMDIVYILLPIVSFLLNLKTLPSKRVISLYSSIIFFVNPQDPRRFLSCSGKGAVYPPQIPRFDFYAAEDAFRNYSYYSGLQEYHNYWLKGIQSVYSEWLDV